MIAAAGEADRRRAEAPAEQKDPANRRIRSASPSHAGRSAGDDHGRWFEISFFSTRDTPCSAERMVARKTKPKIAVWDRLGLRYGRRNHETNGVSFASRNQARWRRLAPGCAEQEQGPETRCRPSHMSSGSRAINDGEETKRRTESKQESGYWWAPQVARRRPRQLAAASRWRRKPAPSAGWTGRVSRKSVATVRHGDSIGRAGENRRTGRRVSVC